MPSKTPSVVLGAAVYTVLAVLFSFLATRGGPALQAAAGCGVCLAVLAGPLVAVWHFASTHRATLLAGQGAGLGALAGAVGALGSGLVSQALISLDVLPDAAEALAMQRDQMLSQGMDPAQIDSAMQMAETLGTLSANPVLGIVAGVALGAALGALVGAVGASMFRKGDAGGPRIVRERA